MRGLADTCDTCGKLKGETNHWFGIRMNRDLATVLIMPFSKIPEDQLELFELACGAGCLLKRVSERVVTL